MTFLLLVVIIGFLRGSAADWPQEQHDASRSSFFPASLQHLPLWVSPFNQWTRNDLNLCTLTNMEQSQAVVDKEGVLYYVRHGAFLKALYPDNSQKWEIEWKSGFGSNLALDLQNNIIYAYSCSLLQLSLGAFSLSNGTMMEGWPRNFLLYTAGQSPLVHPNGMVIASLAAAGSNHSIVDVYALKPNSLVQWKYSVRMDNIETIFQLTSAVGSNGTLFILASPDMGDSDVSFLYAVNPDSGHELWQYKMAGYVERISVVRPDGRIVLQYHNGTTLVVRVTGSTPVIEKALQLTISAVDSNSTMYGYDSSNSVIKMDPNGTVVWAKTLAMYVSALSVDGQSLVYVSSPSGLFALSAETGAVLWVAALPAKQIPVIAGDGSLLVKGGANLYKIGCCSAHGTCQKAGCVCVPNYFGDSCSKFCNNSACSTSLSGHGHCTSTGNCECEPNYFPPLTCDTHCVDSNCTGNAHCSSQGVCICDKNYGGSDCNVLCYNGRVENSACICNEDYYGSACNQSCACVHGKCDNRGVCVCDKATSFWGMGAYEGADCSIEKVPVVLGLTVGGGVAVLFFLVLGVCCICCCCRSKRRTGYSEIH